MNNSIFKATFVVFIIAIAATPSTEAAKDKAANSSPVASPTLTTQASKDAAEAQKKADAEKKAQAEAEAKAQAEAEAKAQVEAEAKAKADEEAKAKEAALAAEEQVKNPEWNTSDEDAINNGNIYLAMDMIKAIKNIPDGEAISTQMVFKTPWNYYGKAISFTGTVGVVEDYPPDSDLGKSGFASEIVIECDDSSIVDFFVMVPSGNIQVGDYVTITAYPVGRTEVQNTMGGSFTHLVVVTNRIN